MIGRAFLALILIASASIATAQDNVVRVPVELSVNVPVNSDYDDTALKNSIAAIVAELTAIKARLAELEQQTPTPDPDPVPGPTPEPQPPAEASLLAEITFQDQDEIDANTVNVSNNASGSNEDVVYDPNEGGAALITDRSLELYNRVELYFPEVTTGHLVAVWDYKPAADWDANNSLVDTHKMFMLGCRNKPTSNDRRVFEQRFHYHIDGSNDGRWLIDTRSYGGAPDTTGEGSGLDRITPWSPVFATVGQWATYVADIDFTKPVPEYSLWMDQAPIYQAIPLPTLVEQGGIDFFSPTWASTSSPANTSRLTHGYLRDARVYHSPTTLDTSVFRGQ